MQSSIFVLGLDWFRLQLWCVVSGRVTSVHLKKKKKGEKKSHYFIFDIDIQINKLLYIIHCVKIIFFSF